MALITLLGLSLMLRDATTEVRITSISGSKEA